MICCPSAVTWGYLQPPVQEKIKADGRLTLLEHRFPLRNATRSGVAKQLVEVIVAHPVEQRKSLDDGPINLHRR